MNTAGAAAAPGVAGRVLLIEDDEGLQDCVQTALGLEGYVVEIAPHGLAALTRLGQADQPRPDLILLDMRMPIMDGWAFARAYQSLPEPHAPIIVFTAARDAAARAGEIKASDVLAKPFALEDLLEIVERYTSSPGSR